MDSPVLTIMVGIVQMYNYPVASLYYEREDSADVLNVAARTTYLGM